MVTEFLERCEVIEECYEFLLAYAAQGLPTDEGSSAEKVVPIFIGRVKHYSDWPKVTDKLSLTTSSNQRRSTIRFVRYWSAMRRTPWQPLTWCSRNLRSVLS